MEGLPIGLPTIGEQTLASFYIAGGIYLFIFAVRYLLDHSPWIWTERIPRVTWVVLSLGIAIPICIYWEVNQVSDIFALAGWEMKPMVGFVCTGIAISVSSNLIHLTFSWMGHKRRNSLGVVELVPGAEGRPTLEDNFVSAPDTVIPSAPALEPSEPAPPEILEPTEPEPSPPADPVVPVENDTSTTVAYLLNICDTDPDIGPHFALVDGKLYRVEHGLARHLPKGYHSS